MKRNIIVFLIVLSVMMSMLCLTNVSAGEQKFHIYYDFNNGTGSCTDKLSYNSGQNAYVLSPNGMSYSGRDFIFWSTKANGEGDRYYAGDVIKMAKDMYLYAIWEPCPETMYKIIYSNNKANGSWQSKTETYRPDVALTLTACPFSNSGYTFAGWNTATNGNGVSFADKSKIFSLNSKILNYDSNYDGRPDGLVLYAQWKKTSGGKDTVNYSGFELSADMKTLVSCPVGCEGTAEIPSTVETIGDYAFYDCNKVSRIILPGNIKYLNSHAFYGCTSLARINFPATLSAIGEYAFGNCVSLPSAAIISSITEVGKCAFAGCIKLASVDNKSGAPRIRSGTFAGCYSLSSVSLPSAPSAIDEYAFSRCSALKEIDFPSNIARINSHAFEYCENLSTCGVHPDIYTEYGAFFSCNISTLRTSPGIHTISASMFICCDNIDNFYVSENIQSVEANAFSPVKNLRCISIDSAVQSIVAGAFDGCGCPILLGDSSYVEKYATANNYPLVRMSKNGNSFSINIAADTCESIVIPKSYCGLTVDSIEANAFANHLKLKSVTLSSTVKTVGASAFAGCSSLSELIIENGVEVISDYAFSNTALSKVSMPSSVKKLSGSAFSGCSNIVILYDNGRAEGVKPEIATEKTETMGKMQGYGPVNSFDAFLVLQSVIGKTSLTAEQFAAADVDGDGCVTATDAYIILKMSINL